MTGKNPVLQIMRSELPSAAEQQKGFQPTQRQVIKYYKLLNHHIFENKLTIPDIKIKRLRNYWAYCTDLDSTALDPKTEIVVTNRYPSIHFFITTLAHEMIHQYQWEIEAHKIAKIAMRKTVLGRRSGMNHGPSFFKWRYKFKKHGLPLLVKGSKTKVMKLIYKYNFAEQI